METLPFFDGLLEAPRDRSFFVFGLRGVGKSTWSRQAIPAAYRIDLLDEGLYQAYLRDSSLFAGELRALPRGTTVVVDEIQRLPTLLNEVHRFIEERRLRFVLLGSTARKLKQAGANLLAGRAVQRQLLPLLPLHGPHDGGGLSRHSRRHPRGLAPARLRREAARQGTAAPQALLDR